MHQMWNPMNSNLPLSSFDFSTDFIFTCQYCLTHQIYISLKISYYLSLEGEKKSMQILAFDRMLVIQSSMCQYSHHLPPPHHLTHRSHIFNQHNSEFSLLSLLQAVLYNFKVLPCNISSKYSGYLNVRKPMFKILVSFLQID